MPKPICHIIGSLSLLLFALGAPSSGAAASLAEFDLTQPAVARQWHMDHHIASLKPGPNGLEGLINGEDPYFSGPARDYPPDQPLWVELRLKSDAGGGGQLFYFTRQPSEKRSVRFQVLPGKWQTVRLKLPPLGPGYRFRIDPPGQKGKFVLAAIKVSAAVVFRPPQWAAPAPLILTDQAPSVRSGPLVLRHATNALGGFELRVQGQSVAIGLTHPQMGYLRGDAVHWFTFDRSRADTLAVRAQNEGLVVEGHYTDDHQGRWHITQRFTPARTSGAIEVMVRVEVSEARSVIFLPLLGVLPGVGSFGSHKHQGLFAGLEYLADEPSRSEADVRGPAANRLVPDTLKITFPLMTIQAADRYVGLLWEMQPEVCALFDSPDRTFNRGGHAMLLVFPGSDGRNREDGQLFPHDGARLAPERPLELRATIIGGLGQSAVPAVRKYMELRGLPPLPKTLSVSDYVRTAAGGWLDSKGREGNRFRHAVWPGFNAAPAADSAFYMDWLAQHTPDRSLAARLRDTARDALAAVSPEVYYASGVGHERFPLAPLVYGHVLENARHAGQVARQLLRRFEPDGRVLYRKAPNKPDYGSTHFARDANGLTAQVVKSLLEAATFSGERELIDQALKRLRALDKFRNTVPRGAQTWECPLHTPDILAAAHLVRAYTLGYELTGDPALLEQAKYWAWTGVPFVYLRNPTEQPMGPYLTPPVYGATSWRAPVWMGLPVQWCGLVYADALYRFAQHDPRGPWQQLAEGITIGGVQVTWPLSDPDRQGLLPDVFHLREQHRDGPAINPGTVQACAVRWYTHQPLYDFRVVRERGWTIHAPGRITAVRSEARRATFQVEGWPNRPYFIYLNGLRGDPTVKLNGTSIPAGAAHQYASGRLVLKGQGRAAIELRMSVR